MNKIVILTESAFFKRGQVVEKYETADDGIMVEGKFVTEGQYVMLTEKLSDSDERRIKELIKQQLKLLFYNLYSKQSFIVN